MISVFLVDDHEIVRCGVADLIDDEEDLVVVGQAGTVAEAMVRIPAANPDIAVLDIRLPDGNGVELCRELRALCPDLNCLMLTSFTDEQAMLELIGEGLTNRQISTRMFLSEKTIKNYVSRLLAKLGVERRTQAAVLATKLAERRMSAERFSGR
ncbi:response regulator transcription factor [Mycobacteroides chelonae]|uniref:response regulator transcription factor n=1 Tax=Mycobacteroides chelonae TaxID=1774 RepID=UPI00099433DC|nr:response regulator transcription factor [Mycobacteroides chelonae]